MSPLLRYLFSVRARLLSILRKFLVHVLPLPPGLINIKKAARSYGNFPPADASKAYFNASSYPFGPRPLITPTAKSEKYDLLRKDSRAKTLER
jgi:hypothetical protein